MGTYKGNKGNLMQHWTLCEVLRIAWDSGVRALNYIDAHAMAPLAAVRTGSGRDFDRVCESLPGQKSLYERAWQKLSPKDVDWYPNSANLVRQVWQGEFSLLLCEKEDDIAADIGDWLFDVGRLSRCKKTECYPGDWRCRFDQRLPRPTEAGLSEDALTYISFDPYMISRTHLGKNLGNIYLCDIERIGRAAAALGSAVLMQLSTYSNGRSHQNSQCRVIQSVDSELTGRGGFDRVAVVRADGNMMSLIYASNLHWKDKLNALGHDFMCWLESV